MLYTSVFNWSHTLYMSAVLLWWKNQNLFFNNMQNVFSSPDHVISPSGPALGNLARGSLSSPPKFPDQPLAAPAHLNSKFSQQETFSPEELEKDRRCSVISVNQTKSVMKFPVKNKKIYREKLGDIRRPSDLWQGINELIIFILQKKCIYERFIIIILSVSRRVLFNLFLPLLAWKL